ncbi:MAG: hypothetical protein QM594_07985 [Niabella sp.]
MLRSSGIYKLLFASFFLVVAPAGLAQLVSFEKEMDRLDRISVTSSRERLFVHYDRPQYHINDTLWLKGYIVSGYMNKVNDSSRIAYIEFINSGGELVKRISAICEIGLFYSNITLNDQLFPQGTYTLRAYTNYMRNFGDSLFFESSFNIIDPKAALWKATINDLRFEHNRLFMAAGLRSENRVPLANSRVEVTLLAGNKRWFRKSMVADAGGHIYLDTLLKDATPEKNLRLEIANSELKLQIPVPTGQQDIDLQFLPEGGSFVAGYSQRLGFKALNVLGKGVNVKGVIKNSKDDVIVDFAAVHKGMGIVSLTPQANEVYTAVLENGAVYKLPPVQPLGQVLRADYLKDSDTIVIKVDAGLNTGNTDYFLTGSVRGYHYLKVALKGRKQYQVKVPAAVFPGGVARFTLYSENGTPVNERALFIWHGDDLKLNLSMNKSIYVKKDSVSLSLLVENGNNEKVRGSFSLSAIDTSQVSVNGNADNIVSYMYLGSDLKGTVEEPFYYIKHPRSRAVDALMLTQGWVNYDVADTVREYGYEKEFEIGGKITNIANKPVTNAKVLLFGNQGRGKFFYRDTVTDKNGQFLFKEFPVFTNDSISTLIRAANKKDRSFGIGVEVFEKEYPAMPQVAAAYNPNSIVFDTAAKGIIDRRSAVMEQLKRDGHFMEEVTVTAQARIQGSKNLNEDGGADQKITQTVLDQTPKASLFDLLTEKLPGFGVRYIPKTTVKQGYYVNFSQVYFVFDGKVVAGGDFPSPNGAGISSGVMPEKEMEQEIESAGSDPVFEYANMLMEYYNAEDVKGIEIMSSARFNREYKLKFLDPVQLMDPAIDYTFIEITTHGGVGEFLKKKPGMYLLKPNAPFVGRKFYSPRYASPSEETVFPDMRPTVYWNSDVVTSEKGEAHVSFYTSESKGSYLVIIQGTDLKGRFGALIVPLKIKPD